MPTEGRKIRPIIMNKLSLVNNVYRLLGKSNVTKERTDMPIIITAKNGLRYLLFNKYIRSNVRAKSKQITAKNIYNFGKK